MKKYKTLKYGDIIKIGDEYMFSNISNKWRNVPECIIGNKVVHSPAIRREIKKVRIG